MFKEKGRRRETKYLGRETTKTVSYLDLEFTESSGMFQEIENVKDFGIESCWSAIGGFVGIFIGYSLRQLPEIFGNIWKNLIQKFKYHL